jgi:hypothetical protein
MKIAEQVGSKIIELNGGKSPNAVFLVGGGAHTPFIRDNIAKILNLPLQRVAIKGREAAVECVCDASLGSIGVTVLGIALISVKRLGNDFVDVTINDKIISLFNAHKHTVMDVMVQEGINPKILIGKNGKNIRFTVDAIKRVAFGALAKGAEIKINNSAANIDSEVIEGDVIEVSFCIDGKTAEPKIIDYVKNIQAVSFYFEDIIRNIEPVAFINGKRVLINAIIKENDDINIEFPATIQEYIKYFGNEENNLTFMMDNKELHKDYVIKEGDRIYSVTLKNENPDEYVHVNDVQNKLDLTIKDLVVEVNKKIITLKNKDKYIFVDIFSYVDFDLSKSKGNLILTLNESKASYYQQLNSGDIIQIYWEK